MNIQNGRNRAALARAALFGATVIWGSSFFVMKNTLAEIPVFYLLAVRFLTGAAVLLLLSLKKLKSLKADTVLKGGILGALLFCGYVAQTFGLVYTTPGKNAFLTAFYCILVPFFYWAVARVRPDRFNILASVVCVAGIGLVSLTGGLSIRTGDALTLLCGVFYALHIVSVAVFSKDHDIFLLTLVQFACAALLGSVCGVLFETFPRTVSPGSVWSLVYLCFLATAAALLMQNIGQKYTPPSTAALILSLESVFGALFSVIFYGERLSLRTVSGFVLIFLAVILSETKLSFLKRKKEA